MKLILTIDCPGGDDDYLDEELERIMPMVVKEGYREGEVHGPDGQHGWWSLAKEGDA